MATTVNRAKILASLGGEELELDTPVDTILVGLVEPLGPEDENEGRFLVLVESEDEANRLENISDTSFLVDATWSTDVSREDHEYLESISVTELEERVRNF